MSLEKKNILFQYGFDIFDLFFYYIYIRVYSPVTLRPNTGHDLLILEVSRSHSTTYHSRWDVFWTNDQLVAQTYT
jgi:hypothetical protein